ncbi:MAG TPA: DUF550 domain-containing protein [Verrucomicrobiota bacterium]|nr:DUF550 domain-containing protein [Verrucomicrobiota bacterium]
MRTNFEHLFLRVRQFQKRTFPHQSLNGKLNHAAREIEEIRKRPEDISEHADLLILAIAVAGDQGFTPEQLIAAAHEKMDINFLRKWSAPDAAGVCSHQEIYDGGLGRMVTEL